MLLKLGKRGKEAKFLPHFALWIIQHNLVWIFEPKIRHWMKRLPIMKVTMMTRIYLISVWNVKYVSVWMHTIDSTYGQHCTSNVNKYVCLFYKPSNTFAQ